MDVGGEVRSHMAAVQLLRHCQIAHLRYVLPSVYVLRLQVAVADVASVKVLHPAGRLEQTFQLVFVGPLLALYLAQQATPLEKFSRYHQIQPLLLFVKESLVDDDDVFVVEPRESFLEAVDLGCIVGLVPYEFQNVVLFLCLSKPRLVVAFGDPEFGKGVSLELALDDAALLHDI